MRPLIALDWGTSSLRAARLGDDGHALEERSFDKGLLHIPEGGFPAMFEEACGDWMRAPGALAILCGMVGSRQGWREAPYRELPASLQDVANAITWIEAGRIALVPGLARTDGAAPDVMRGEETKAFGVAALLGAADVRIVMPGTHCKWATLRGHRLVDFSTFMTGEFYAVLRQHSILGRTMAADDGDLDEAAFVRGVDHARETGNLLHAAFSARTLSLFDRLSPEAAPSYLSGLLIGEELRTQATPGESLPLVLVGAEKLTQRYAIALAHAGLAFHRMGQEATWLGLATIARTLETSP